MEEKTVNSIPNPKTRLLVCIPGAQFSGGFLDSWTQLFGNLLMRGFKVTLSREYVSTLPVVRHRCLQVKARRGDRPEIFGGNYDYMLWIDSDQIYSYEDFEKLYRVLRFRPDLNVVSGYYSYSDMQGFAFGWIEETGEFMHVQKGHKELVEKAKASNDLIQVDWSGMGFMLVRKGVFEAIDYPYFAHAEFKLNDADQTDVMGEDLYWGQKLKAAGIPIYIHPEVRIGHEKPVIL